VWNSTFRDRAPACTALHCLAKRKGGAVDWKVLQVELVCDSDIMSRWWPMGFAWVVHTWNFAQVRVASLALVQIDMSVM
jgi:hypothetical protein